jgi:uncharacterized membrane protein
VSHLRPVDSAWKTFAAAMLFAAFVLSLPGSTARAAVDPMNLVRNGDFEEPGMPPPGWKIEVPSGGSFDLAPRALTGSRALRISMPVAGNATATSDPCTVAAGEDYLLTFWYRADGMSAKGSSFDGCTANCYILWQDATGKDLGNTLCCLPYGPVPDYGVCTFTATAPDGAARASIRFPFGVGQEYKGPATALFLDEVRLMKLSKPAVPSNAEKWEYAPRYLYLGMKLVEDRDASKGTALVAELGQAGMYATLAGGQYGGDQPVGDYLVIFRLKVKETTNRQPVVSLRVTDLGNLNFSIADKVLYANDFKSPGAYQDFAMRFVRPEDGMVDFSVTYLAAATDVFYDKTTVVQLSSLASDQERAAIWLGESDASPAPAAAAPRAPAGDTVLVLAGFGNQTCFPAHALSGLTNLTFKYTYPARIQTGYVLDQPFPRKLEELNGVGAIVVADVPASTLSGLMGRRTLRQFVEQGGGLLVFGGPFALGKGDIAGSAFEAALPVATTGPWDLVKARSRAVKLAKASPITEGLRWDARPVLPYYQKTVAKPGSEVLLEADGFPVLITGRYGKGRVAVFAGTDMGAPGKDEVLFYKWPDYGTLLGRVMQWLLKR